MGAAVESRPRTPLEDDAFFETLGAEAGPVRVFSQPYKARSGREGVIQVAQDLGDVPLPLASLRWALLLMSPLAVALAGLGGYGLARNALGPVAEVTRLAREIGAGSLNRRLPTPRTQDEIGGLVTTLNQMIARKEVDADARQALRQFCDDVVECPIVVGDLHTGNIVYAHDEERGHHFVMIDGIGDKTLIPLLRLFPRLRARSKRRKIRWLWAKVDGLPRRGFKWW